MQFSSFSLDDRLHRAVTAAGYTTPTPIQEQAIPAALAGHDLIGTAQTGTGKTAAFVLPLLHRLLTTPGPRGKTRALIVTPTRELAEQVHAALRQLGKFTKIKSATVYGGVGMEPQTKALRQGVEVIVACPGRLLDHLGRGNADLSQVEVVVLDEADRMLDMGFLPSVRDIVARTPKTRQTLLFSATFAPELQQLGRQILHEPQRVEVGLTAPPQTVAHTLCPVEATQKTTLLLQLLGEAHTGSVLVFTRTKHRADRVARQMEQSGHRAAVLHSNRTQNQRQAALESFRKGKVKLLVATDIAARGLDIAGVSHVINYDIPDTPDAYIHRIGRTGRAECSGDALTLVTADDKSVVRDIERVLGEPIAVRKVGNHDYGLPTFAATSSGGRNSGSGGKGTMTSWSSGGGGWHRGSVRRPALRRAR